MERDYEYDLTPKDIAGKDVVFVKELGPANVHNPQQPRNFDEVESKLFPSLRATGFMKYGPESKWDDRKYRLNKPFDGVKKIVVPLGLTHFGVYSADIERSNDVNRLIQSIGSFEFNDKWAYFSRVLCAMFIPITRDGFVFIGEKVSNNPYNGFLISAAGHVDYHGAPSFENFQEQAINELKEEYGKRLTLIGAPRFAGIASHTFKGDANAVWVGRIDATQEYFTSGKWLKERKDAEHTANLVKISTCHERNQLLNNLHLNGRDFPGIVYATRLGLESLTDEDFQSL